MKRLWNVSHLERGRSRTNRGFVFRRKRSSIASRRRVGYLTTVKSDLDGLNNHGDCSRAKRRAYPCNNLRLRLPDERKSNPRHCRQEDKRLTRSVRSKSIIRASTTSERRVRPPRGIIYYTRLNIPYVNRYIGRVIRYKCRCGDVRNTNPSSVRICLKRHKRPK